MKKLILFILLAVFVVMQVQAQKCKAKDVPSPVMNAFNKDYPNSKKTCWGKDSDNYLVAFYNGKAPVSVTYDPGGKKIITEIQMAVEDMAQSIMDYVKKNYPSETIVEAAQITDTKGIVTYEVQVKDIDLVFDAKGNFIQSLKCYD